jgi:hypothetical protein
LLGCLGGWGQREGQRPLGELKLTRPVYSSSQHLCGLGILESVVSAASAPSRKIGAARAIAATMQ